MIEVKTLGDALPEKMKYVREVVIPAYQECSNGAGVFALAMINQSLTNAEEALASGDVVKMLRAYEDLDGIEL